MTRRSRWPLEAESIGNGRRMTMNFRTPEAEQDNNDLVIIDNNAESHAQVSGDFHDVNPIGDTWDPDDSSTYDVISVFRVRWRLTHGPNGQLVFNFAHYSHFDDNRHPTGTASSSARAENWVRSRMVGKSLYVLDGKGQFAELPFDSNFPEVSVGSSSAGWFAGGSYWTLTNIPDTPQGNGTHGFRRVLEGLLTTTGLGDTRDARVLVFAIADSGTLLPPWHVSVSASAGTPYTGTLDQTSLSVGTGELMRFVATKAEIEESSVDGNTVGHSFFSTRTSDAIGTVPEGDRSDTVTEDGTSYTARLNRLHWETQSGAQENYNRSQLTFNLEFLDSDGNTVASGSEFPRASHWLEENLDGKSLYVLNENGDYCEVKFDDLTEYPGRFRADQRKLVL